MRFRLPVCLSTYLSVSVPLSLRPPRMGHTCDSFNPEHSHGEQFKVSRLAKSSCDSVPTCSIANSTASATSGCTCSRASALEDYCACLRVRVYLHTHVCVGTHVARARMGDGESKAMMRECH